jgi:hypothetical protein
MTVLPLRPPLPVRTRAGPPPVDELVAVPPVGDRVDAEPRVGPRRLTAERVDRVGEPGELRLDALECVLHAGDRLDRARCGH